ncbi:MAG: hypothetical protein ABI622_03285 [Chloroflexota bacterium]
MATTMPLDPGSDDALNGVLAAIAMVADHGARRITVHVPDGASVIGAVHLLARARGVEVRPVGSGRGALDLVLELPGG